MNQFIGKVNSVTKKMKKMIGGISFILALCYPLVFLLNKDLANSKYASVPTFVFILISATFFTSITGKIPLFSSFITLVCILTWLGIVIFLKNEDMAVISPLLALMLTKDFFESFLKNELAKNQVRGLNLVRFLFLDTSVAMYFSKRLYCEYGITKISQTFLTFFLFYLILCLFLISLFSLDKITKSNEKINKV